MKRWLGMSAAVGSATAAVVAGAAWAGPVETAVAHAEDAGERGTAHSCGHRDMLDARVEPRGGGTVLVVRAVDGVADPVEAAFDGTTVRIPGQRGAAAAGAGSAELRLLLPGAAAPRDVRVEATFDDGITRCAWTVRVPAPREE
ncbi:MAG: hypothetical protein AVDCRST_MAG34-2943 [uncultured Nocardioidaceae bacterium]|uniref:Secreted protein n=1 Tax=uncultured Nocardioidaceae bacterium TaxID=253824 RepID=A0A6J4MSY6_9ACTN|nr:MAG: hypothetical protein AVDCRST_MAG34-2943 [uncultured Nocardioidaceae bacterium]